MNTLHIHNFTENVLKTKKNHLIDLEITAQAYQLLIVYHTVTVQRNKRSNLLLSSCSLSFIFTENCALSQSNRFAYGQRRSLEDINLSFKPEVKEEARYPRRQLSFNGYLISSVQKNPAGTANRSYCCWTKLRRGHLNAPMNLARRSKLFLKLRVSHYAKYGSE